MKSFKTLIFTFVLLAFCGLAAPLYAQNNAPNNAQQAQDNVYKVKAQALSASEIMIKNRKVPLWGVNPVQGVGTLFQLEAQLALENLIGGAELECELITVEGKGLNAQCVNGARTDLSHEMLQNGYVILDRPQVYGSVFEEPYLRAEMQARQNARGIWASGKEEARSVSVARSGLIINGLILLVLVGSAIVMIRIIQQGFEKVIDAQNQTLENFNKEQILRDKEKQVVASMLRSEIAENQSKIEAHLTIYQDLLKDLQDPEKTAKYQTSGDIIQKQPALDRGIFDANAHKMELFERRFASEIVHFYARVKTTPEYVNVDSETPREEVIKIVKDVVENAQTLHKRAEALALEFVKYGFGGPKRAA